MKQLTVNYGGKGGGFVRIYDTLVNAGINPQGIRYNSGASEFWFLDDKELSRESELIRDLRNSGLTIECLTVKEGVKLN